LPFVPALLAMLKECHRRMAHQGSRRYIHLLRHERLQACEAQKVPICAMDVVMRTVHRREVNLLLDQLEAEVAEARAAETRSAILVVVVRCEFRTEAQTEFVRRSDGLLLPHLLNQIRKRVVLISLTDYAPEDALRVRSPAAGVWMTLDL